MFRFIKQEENHSAFFLLSFFEASPTRLTVLRIVNCRELLLLCTARVVFSAISTPERTAKRFRMDSALSEFLKKVLVSERNEVFLWHYK